MQSQRWRTWAGLALVCVLSTPVLAGPPDPALVDADAAWVLYLDVDALRQTTFYQALRRTAGDKADRWLAGIKQMAGMNLETDLRDICVYSPTLQEGQFVALLRGTFDPAAITALLAMNPDYATQKHGDHTVHTWVDRGRGGAGCFVGKELVVVANDVPTLQRGLDVLDRARTGGTRLLQPGGNGLFAQMQVADLGALPAKARSQLGGLARRVRMSMGETNGELALAVTIGTDDAERAEALRKIVDGLKALVLLRDERHPELGDLLRGVAVTVEGADVTVTLRHDSRGLVDLMQTARERRRGATSATSQPAAP